MVETFQCTFEGLTLIIEIIVRDKLINPRITARSGRADQHIRRQCVIYNNFYRSHDDDDVIVLTARAVPAGDDI